MKKWCLHPGFVTSKNDGDEHYISAGKLMELYGLKREECGIYKPEISLHIGNKCLFPLYYGRYRRRK